MPQMRLIGWYGSEGHGYAVPLFGQTEGANTLCVARCSVSGDHRGKIADFDPVDVGDYEGLPAGESIGVSVGDAWLDIFVWWGKAYVGTPDELWAKLEPFRGGLERKAPVSFLDLALSAEQLEEVKRLAPVVFDFIEERFDRSIARRWRRQFVRQSLETRSRRKLAAHDFAEESFRSIAVEEDRGHGLTAVLPAAMLSALTEMDVIDELADGLADLGRAMRAEVRLPGVAEEKSAEGEVGEVLETVPDGASPEVCVIALGKRSQDVIRHLKRNVKTGGSVARAADWVVASGPEAYEQAMDRDGVLAATVLLLVDEDDPLWGESRKLDQLARELADRGALVIVVPALSVRQPSRLLEGGHTARSLVWGCHAVLDSSIARSPFWWGRSKRSTDRRIADVMTVACAACRDRGLRKELVARGTDGPPPVLVVGLLPDAGIGSYGGESHLDALGSEASWVAENGEGGDSAILFSLRIRPEGVGLGDERGHIVAEGRRHSQRFAGFAEAVVGRALGLRQGGRGRLSARVEERAIPDSIIRRLALPGHARGFGVEARLGASVRLAVVGERPTVEAVVAAEEVGWRIARYTDSATIRRVADGSGRGDFVPAEIELGSIRSNPTNRVLATRGVDQRDVYRLGRRVIREWKDRLGSDGRRLAEDEVRPMRSATRPPGHEGDYLVRREYLAIPDAPGASELGELSGGPLKTRALKRRGDLRRCWTRPSAGFRRFGLVDGAVPAIVVEIGPDEVPVEDLFVVDGDEAVPALFRSKVFGIWAAATLPNASSWMARFSITLTFGGFPIVEPFRIVGQEGELAALASDEAPHRFYTLAEEVGRQIEREMERTDSRGWREAHRIGTTGRSMDRLNEMILDWYGLAKDASDISILRRLLDLNARLH